MQYEVCSYTRGMLLCGSQFKQWWWSAPARSFNWTNGLWRMCLKFSARSPPFHNITWPSTALTPPHHYTLWNAFQFSTRLSAAFTKPQLYIQRSQDPGPSLHFPSLHFILYYNLSPHSLPLRPTPSNANASELMRIQCKFKCTLLIVAVVYYQFVGTNFVKCSSDK